MSLQTVKMHYLYIGDTGQPDGLTSREEEEETKEERVWWRGEGREMVVKI